MQNKLQNSGKIFSCYNFIISGLHTDRRCKTPSSGTVPPPAAPVFRIRNSGNLVRRGCASGTGNSEEEDGEGRGKGGRERPSSSGCFPSAVIAGNCHFPESGWRFRVGRLPERFAASRRAEGARDRTRPCSRAGLFSVCAVKENHSVLRATIAGLPRLTRHSGIFPTGEGVPA